MVYFPFGEVQEDDHQRDEEKILANHGSLLFAFRYVSFSSNHGGDDVTEITFV